MHVFVLVWSCNYPDLHRRRGDCDGDAADGTDTSCTDSLSGYIAPAPAAGADWRGRDLRAKKQTETPSFALIARCAFCLSFPFDIRGVRVLLEA